MVRFIKYSAVTLPAFLVDLGLLVLFVQILHIHYVLAAGSAFVIATTANYLVSRQWVFADSHRSLTRGYAYFLIIAGTGLLMVTVLLWVSVSLLHFNYVIARIVIALIEGLWNYLMNLYFNFRVAGK